MLPNNVSGTRLATFLSSDPLGWPWEAIVSSISLCLVAFLVSNCLVRSPPDAGVYDIGGLPIVTAWPFFTKRFDFLQRHFKKTGGKMFKFKILRVRPSTNRAIECVS